MKFRVATLFLAGLVAACMGGPQGGLDIGDNDIGGTVTSANGPEAGVWVIAETADLPTRYAKLVVTDDQGRYLIPDLPKANYRIWVRGYGLIDSHKMTSEPGNIVNLVAVPAPNPAAAAEYYPGMYWYSLLDIPPKSEFPGTGEKGNGISPNIKTQEAWIDTVKNACQSCHAFGSKGIRTVPKEFGPGIAGRSEAHTSELQSLGRISYAVFCLNDGREVIQAFQILFYGFNHDDFEIGRASCRERVFGRV